MNQSATQQPASNPTESPQPDATAIARQLIRPKRAVASPAELALLAQAQRRNVLSKGRQLAAWTWGSDGPTVLLVHGWDSRASHLGQLIGSLLHHGYRIVAFDNPGHGESEGTASNVVDIGDAVLDVAGELGPFDGLIGHSVGSPASLYAFARGMGVRASVHIAGPSSLKRVLSRVAAMCQLSGEETDHLYRLMEKEIGASLDVMDLDRLATGMRHPALLLHDPEDREVPYSESVELQAAWPQAELAPLPGVGHRRIVRESPAIEASIGFFNRHLRGSIR